ncbi:MAG: gamma-glutamyltransferase [Pseudomonadota bacterium]|nr:gamma-glutamyltransferase [Pseudomonadota bacterium]
MKRSTLYGRALRLSVLLFAPSVAIADGVASTAHPLASNTAEEIFKLGGNAADAAIAVSFVLSVVEPTLSGLGGRAQALVRTPADEYHSYNGMTEIPAVFKVDDQAAAYGYSTIATPGLVALLEAIHKAHGSLPIEKLVEPAQEFARQGIKLLPGEAARQASVAPIIRQDPGMAAIFLDSEDKAFSAGALLQQPALATTLSRLAETGLASFYRGHIAEMISRDVQANGGFITPNDLSKYRILPGNYIAYRYRDHTVHTLAAPGGGGLVVRALSLLQLFEMEALGDASWAMLVNQALGLAILSMTDDYYEKDMRPVLDGTWARKRSPSIHHPVELESAANVKRASRIARLTVDRKLALQNRSNRQVDGHTSHFSIHDCSGMTISLTQTLGPVFGAKVATAELGIVYAATMGRYLRTGRNIPGERPRTSIAPVIVTLNGQVVMTLGAAGGIRIPSAIVQVISRVVDRDMPLESAIAAPRVHPMSTIDEQNVRHVNLKGMEVDRTDNGWPRRVIRRWRSVAFDIDEIKESGRFGRVYALEGLDGRIEGFADPAGEGASSPAVNCRNGKA